MNSKGLKRLKKYFSSCIDPALKEYCSKDQRIIAVVQQILEAQEAHVFSPTLEIKMV